MRYYVWAFYARFLIGAFRQFRSVAFLHVVVLLVHYRLVSLAVVLVFPSVFLHVRISVKLFSLCIKCHLV